MGYRSLRIDKSNVNRMLPMYALFCTMLLGVVRRIFSPRQAHFEQHTAASAQKTIKLRGARAVRHWLDNARPSRAPQGHVGLVG